MVTVRLNGAGEVSLFLSRRLFLHDATIESMGTRVENGIYAMKISAPYEFRNGKFVELKEEIEIELGGCKAFQSNIEGEPAGYDVLSLNIKGNCIEIKTMVGAVTLEFSRIQLIATDGKLPRT